MNDPEGLNLVNAYKELIDLKMAHGTEMKQLTPSNLDSRGKELYLNVILKQREFWERSGYLYYEFKKIL